MLRFTLLARVDKKLKPLQVDVTLQLRRFFDDKQLKQKDKIKLVNQIAKFGELAHLQQIIKTADLRTLKIIELAMIIS